MLVFLLFAGFFDHKAKGWHFYCDPEITSDVDQPKTVPELKKQLQVALDEAIWEPTCRNVLRYIRLQKMLMGKSEKFATTWEHVLANHPDLDPTVKMPTSYYGTLHARETQEKKIADQLAKHMKDFTLFLVVKNDGMSKAMVDVVEDMAKYRGYQITVVNAENQSRLLQKFGIKRLPVLLMIHLDTGKRFVLTYGLISADKIEERMVEIIEKILKQPRIRSESIAM